MAANRLAQILEREYQSQGLISGIGSAMGKRVREKLDVRNSLFSGSGLSGVIGRKVFGKGYSATSGGVSKSDALSSGLTSSLSGQTEKLEEISNAVKVTAKNTLALPSMARDMYLVKQNIIKLVKLNKGTPQTKAGEWFSRQKAREASLNFKTTSPSKTKDGSTTPESSGGIMGMLGGIVGFMGPGKLLGIISGVAAVGVALVGLKGTIEMISKLITRIYNWVAKTEIGRSLGLEERPEGGAAGEGGESGERGWKNPLDVNWSNVGNKSVDVAKNAGAAYLENKGRKFGQWLGKDGSKYVLKNGKFMEVGKAGFTSATKIAGEGNMGKILEALRKFAVEAAKKKWGERLIAKLAGKLGAAVAAKCATMFASLAAAPFSAGLSLLITIVSTAWLLKDIYDIYEAIFGEGGIRDELMEEDKASTSPKRNETNAEIEKNNATISKLKTDLETEKNPYKKESMQKKIAYYEDQNKKIKSSMEESKSPSSGGSDDFNFAEYKRSVGGAESRGDYNTTFNNPNAKINGKPLTENTIAEVAAWQDKNRASNRHAAGKYQFIDVAAAAKDAGLSMSDMFSAINQEKMMDAYTKINAATLKKGGFEASKENLSLAHSVGAGRAVELLNLQKSGKGGLNVATDVLNWKKGENRFDTNPHLNKSVDQVIADAGKRVGSPNYSPGGNDIGTMLASASSSVDPFGEMMKMMGDMLNTYHQQTVAKNEGKNFDGGSLETYNEEFLKKLLESQGFSPNKA